MPRRRNRSRQGSTPGSMVELVTLPLPRATLPSRAVMTPSLATRPPNSAAKPPSETLATSTAGPSVVAARPAIYGDACRKIAEGFDYVELDPAGEIGLVTTGAGLSMMLIDELTARGAKPLP